MRDQLAVAIGVPAVLAYALATAATVLHHDRPLLFAHPFAATATVAGADALLAFAAASWHRARCRRRSRASWLTVLPLDPAVLRHLAAFDALLVLLPLLVALLLVEVALSLLSGDARTLLPTLFPAGCAGIALGVLLARAFPSPFPDRSSPAPPPTRSPSAAHRSGPILRRLDRIAPRHLSAWCARLNRPLRSRLPLLPAPLLVAILFTVLPAPEAAAALPAAAVPCGLILFAATLRTTPLASATLRTLPQSYPRLLFGAARAPLALSLSTAAVLSLASLPFAAVPPSHLVSAPGTVLLLDLSFAVFAARWPGREAVAALAWTATAAMSAYEFPKFGLSVLLLPLLILLLMIRRGLREQPPAPVRNRPA